MGRRRRSPGTRASRRRRVLALCLIGLVAGLLTYRAWGREVEIQLRMFESARRVRPHAEVLEEVALESGVDVHLLAAVMFAESSGRLAVRSSKGALGLFQLMPATAAERARLLGLPEPSEEQLLSDAHLNARLGADYLAWLLARNDGDAQRALVAYNAGPTRLERWIREAGSWEAWREARVDERRGPLAYADKVLRYREHYLEQGLFGAPPSTAPPPAPLPTLPPAPPAVPPNDTPPDLPAAAPIPTPAPPAPESTETPPAPPDTPNPPVPPPTEVPER